MPDLACQPADDNTVEVLSFTVEYEDVFRLQNLYDQALLWISDNEFTSTDTGDDEIETLYHHKVNEDGGVEHRIWWRATRDPSNPYFRYFLKVDFRTINLKTVQMTRDGSQIEADKGDVIINVTSYLLLDAERNWRDSTFGAFFHSYFKNRLYRERINQQRLELWRLTKDFQGDIKQFLDLKHPQPRQDQFHPAYQQ